MGADIIGARGYALMGAMQQLLGNGEDEPEGNEETGYDEDEYIAAIGALARGGRVTDKQKRALKRGGGRPSRKEARQMVPQAAIVDDPPTRVRRYGFGLIPSVAPGVAAGATFTLRGQSERFIRLERLILSPDANLDGFVVLAIAMGVDNQLVNFNPMPASAFARDAVGLTFEGNTIRPGQSASVLVQNITGGPLMIFGGFVGTSAE